MAKCCGGADLNDQGAARRFFEGVSGIAAIWTALLATLAIAFSSPTHIRGWFNSHLPWHRYSVEITAPKQGQGIGYSQPITGKARLPAGWALVVVTETPAELKYHVTSGGAVAVENGRWTIPATFGTNPKLKDKQGIPLRAGDLRKPYKIFALALDASGQTSVQQALAKNGVLLALPDAMLSDIATVNLTK